MIISPSFGHCIEHDILDLVVVMWGSFFWRSWKTRQSGFVVTLEQWQESLSRERLGFFDQRNRLFVIHKGLCVICELVFDEFFNEVVEDVCCSGVVVVAQAAIPVVDICWVFKDLIDRFEEFWPIGPSMSVLARSNLCKQQRS